MFIIDYMFILGGIVLTIFYDAMLAFVLLSACCAISCLIVFHMGFKEDSLITKKEAAIMLGFVIVVCIYFVGLPII